MCLAIPMEVLTIDGRSAEVQVGGTRQTVRLDLISESPEVGDFVIVHAGFALTRLDREEAVATLKLFEEGLNVELI
ncbi:HypC/HybG/HupF family hydrogenase formation chaperone [Desulfomicrobium escambiense]|uniref:HypC/HybG/HupF family hydrogenase formation chaperone n=1 Tax=Desulfomicrobium escambiense TaxID=29503 RepID=UPI00040020F1|nr:HypC/HybG/HupF family hydrogenase formation chaperone [Desulfomicrobium escambiense]